jgi:hypothetical protein
MFNYVFDPSFMKVYAGGTGGVNRRVGTFAGQTIKIMNFTNFDLQVFDGTEEIDYVPAYQFLIIPNSPDLSLTISGIASTNYSYPTPYVAIKTLPDIVEYELGSLIHFVAQAAGDTMNVAGNVTATIQNANIPVTGTVNANITNATLPVQGSVSISGTPTVNFAAGQTVNIGNTPSVAIASGTVNANIQNATINTKETAATIGVTNSIPFNPAICTISNLANNGVIPFIGRMTLASGIQRAYVDAVTFYITNTSATYTNIGSAYQFMFRYLAINGQAYPDNTNNTNLILESGGGNVAVSQTISFSSGSVLCGDFIDMQLTNISGGTIAGDTVTVYAFLHYSNNIIRNQSNQPVPTTGNYYGTGADGVFNSTGNVTQSNPANLPAVYNYKSFTLNSGTTLSFSNQAKYVLIYSQGDVVINGTINSANGVTNIGSPGVPLTINGKTVPNAGNGGAGGNGGNTGSGAGSGGSGGAGNCYTSGAGGGGGGGGMNFNSWSSGSGGGTGYGAATPPTYASAGFSSSDDTNQPASAKTSANPTTNTATICIVAGGSITINGGIYAQGGNGQNGANGGPGGSYTYSGCGGNSGPNGGGRGDIYTGSTTAAYAGGGGSGGAGGGSVFLFAAGNITNNGTIDVNGGSGGAGGSGSVMPTYTGSAGASGAAGSIVMYTMGGNLVG